ncbi:MAG: agmatine deiminase family protein, partial [Lewinella sp.]|nr:agmatine deiminase family protein [Lewinella sp.]
MKSARYLLILLSLLPSLAMAQPGVFWPHEMTAKEQAHWPSFLQDYAKDLGTPPPGPVRLMAEWEEVQALVITWTLYPAILTEIVRYAVDECTVIIVTNDQLSVETQLQTAGIPLDNVEFLPVPFNSVWIRDYGPWTIYQGQVDSLSIADYIYNRPDRTSDDVIPHQVADYLALPLYSAEAEPYRWIHSGGNFLRDGLGNAWSSDLVLRENSGKDGREVAEYARLFFGVDDYRFLQRLPYDRIHHLDMHIRTLDEETLVIGQYPEGISDGPQIEANLAFIRNHYRTPFGRPYRILRQTMPPDNGSYPWNGGDYRTYSN